MIGLGYGVIPGIQKVINEAKNMNQIATTIKQLEEKNRILGSLDRTSLETNARAAVSAVPADKSLGTIFSTIDQLTSREGVSVTSISLGNVGSVATESAKKIGKTTLGEGVNAIPFSIVISGPIEKVRNVVDSAVKIRRLFYVRNFDLSFDAKTGITRSTIQMDAYYVPLPKLLAKVTDKVEPLTEDELTTLGKVAALSLLTPESSIVSTASGQIPLRPETVNPFSP